MAYFNIHIASQLSGVAAATIRAWEKRYLILLPLRSDNGHRLYTENDIEKLSILRQLTTMGHSIGKLANLDINGLKQLLTHGHKEVVNLFGKPSTLLDHSGTKQLLATILLAVNDYQLDVISLELEKIKRLLGPRSFALDVIVPLFREIGHRSMNGLLTISQEHSLSAITQFHMGQMIAQNYGNKKLRPGLLLLAAPEGELHEIGLLAACLLCIEYRVPFIFLGNNLPAAALAEAANQLNPNGILLAVTKGHQIAEHLTLQEYLKTVQLQISTTIQIRVGGNLPQWVSDEIAAQSVEYLPSLETLDLYLKEFR